MKIAKILCRNGGDFWADYECEGCGHIEEYVSGCDDRHYYDNVIPNMVCKKCGKSRIDLGIEGVHAFTRFPKGFQV